MKKIELISIWSKSVIERQELAELIQKGLTTKNVIESRTYFLADFCSEFYVCAMGAAIIGKIGSAREAYNAVEAKRKSLSSRLCNCLFYI